MIKSLEAGIVLIFLLVVLNGVAVWYFGKVHEGVNGFFRCAGRLIVDERWLDVVRHAAKRVRSMSKTYEILITSDEITGEDFQNKGTFMVERSSVFSLISAHRMHLARDAYYACLRSA